MTIHRINNFEDAKRLVESYQLHDWDKGLGSSEGFAAWLYLNVSSVATEQLARRIDEYIHAAVRKQRRDEDFDGEWLFEAGESAGHLLYAQNAMQELAAVARSARRVEVGQRAWSLIAMLATTVDPSAVCEAASPPVVERAWEILRHIKAMEPLLQRAEYHGYVPGQGWEDDLMRSAIERLEEVASADLWFEREAHWPAEVDALLSLVQRANLSQHGSFVSLFGESAALDGTPAQQL